MENGSLLPILMEIKGDLGTLSGKLDGYNDNQLALRVQVNDVDARVRDIEQGRARERGFIAAVVIVGSGIMSAIYNFLIG